MSTTCSKNAFLSVGLSLVLLAAVALLGCHGSAQDLKIQVKSEPIIKVSQGTTLAILPLEGKNYEFDSATMVGEEMDSAMKDLTNFLVIPDEEVKSTLESSDFAERRPGSMQFAYDLGKSLRAAYVLYGTYDMTAEEYSEQGYAPNERYTSEQPYAPNLDYGPSYSMRNWDVHIRYVLSLKVKILDVEKSQLAVDKEFTATDEQTYKASDLPLDNGQLKLIFNSLLVNTADQLRFQLTPHNVDEERYVLFK
jgi:hypothetical protein